MSTSISATLDKSNVQEFLAEEWQENKKLEIRWHQSIFGFDKSKESKFDLK